MTAECLDPSDLRVEQLTSLKFSDLEELAKSMLAMVENGMVAVEILEKKTNVSTKMLRVGITTMANLLRDISVAYEERVKEGK